MASLSEQVQQKIAELLDLLAIEATIQVDETVLAADERAEDGMDIQDKKYLEIHIDAGELGAELIGRHGNMLEAMATVIGLLVPSEERVGIILDINNYRSERTQFIQDMTDRAIEQAVSNSHAIVLDPMKPWERRIVHMSVVGRSDVITESEGEGNDRRVVIKPAA